MFYFFLQVLDWFWIHQPQRQDMMKTSTMSQNFTWYGCRFQQLILRYSSVIPCATDRVFRIVLLFSEAFLSEQTQTDIRLSFFNPPQRSEASLELFSPLLQPVHGPFIFPIYGPRFIFAVLCAILHLAVSGTSKKLHGSMDEVLKITTLPPSLFGIFHDLLSEENSNMIRDELPMVMLKPQFFGSSNDICAGIFDSVLTSAEHLKAVFSSMCKLVSSIYKRDTLSFIT